MRWIPVETLKKLIMRNCRVFLPCLVFLLDVTVGWTSLTLSPPEQWTESLPDIVYWRLVDPDDLFWSELERMGRWDDGIPWYWRYWGLNTAPLWSPVLSWFDLSSYPAPTSYYFDYLNYLNSFCFLIYWCSFYNRLLESLPLPAGILSTRWILVPRKPPHLLDPFVLFSTIWSR